MNGGMAGLLFSLLLVAVAGMAVAVTEREADAHYKRRAGQAFSYAHVIHDHGRPSTGHYKSSGHAQDAVIQVTKQVPYPVLQPYAITVEKHIPYPVSVPVAVPVDRPYPVHVPKPYLVPVERPVPVTVARPYPIPIQYPVKVPVPTPVPVPVAKPYPVYVHGYDKGYDDEGDYSASVENDDHDR